MTTRRERVILELVDDFTPGMVRAAAAAGLLEGRLDSVSRNSVTAGRSAGTASNDVDRLSNSATRGARSIDQYSGRLALMAKATLLLGPGLIKIGAVGIPAVTGLAQQLGFAALGMGSLVVASQGVGDALKAMNEAALEPTAANLEKAQRAMAQLGPDAQAFVTRFQELRPVLKDVRDAAAAGWFPGLTDSLDSLERVAPWIGDLFERIGKTGGDLVAMGADAFAGPEWDEFRDFVSAEAPEALEDLGLTIGNVVTALADMWMAFAPLNSDFSDWLLNASESFREWADGLAETQGFQDFVAYIRESGPQVADALGAIGNAILQVTEAAAPLGGPVLEALELIADAVAAIADTSAGSKIITMAAAFVVLNKALAITAGLLARAGFAGAAGAIRGAGPAGGTGAGAGPAGGVLPLAQRIQNSKGAFVQLRTDLRAMGKEYGNLGRTQSTLLSGFSNTTAAAQRSRATLAGYGSTALKASAGVGAFAVASGSLGEGLGIQNAAMLGLVGSMAGPYGAAIGVAVGATIDMKKAIGGLTDQTEALNSVMASTSASFGQQAGAYLSAYGALQDRLAENEVTGVGDFLTDAFDVNNADSLLGWITDAEGRVNALSDASLAAYESLTGTLIGIEQLANAGIGEGLSFWDDNKADIIAGDFESVAANAAEVEQRMAELNPILDYAGISWAEFSAAAGSVDLNNLIDSTRAKAALGDIGAQAALAKSEIQALATEYTNLNTILTKQGSWDAYQAAIDNMTASVKENGRTLDANTEKGRANRAALNDIAASAIAFSENLSGADRIDFLKNARRAFVDAANQAGGLDRRAREVAGTFDDLIGKASALDGKQINVGVVVKGADAVESHLNYIARSRQSIINVLTRSAGDILPSGGRDTRGGQTRAQGGYISGPGTSTSDSIPAWLSNGEYVIKASSVAKYGTSMMDMLNAGRFADGGLVKGYANGGRVSALGFADLPGLNLAAINLKQLNRALKASEKALDKERTQRDAVTSKISDLRSTVSSNLRSELFGTDTDVWSAGAMGGSLSSVLGILRGDIKTGREFNADVSVLKKKGLKGGALADLLANATASQVDMFANSSGADVLEYQRLYDVRQSLTAGVGRDAGVAAYGAELRQQTRETRAVADRVERLTRVTRQEGRQTRAAARGGARRAASGKSRGYIP